jgi:hypothetical protein
MAATNKCLADSNKTRTSAKPTDAAGGLLITFAEWLQPLRRPRAGQAPFPPSCAVFFARRLLMCGPGYFVHSTSGTVSPPLRSYAVGWTRQTQMTTRTRIVLLLTALILGALLFSFQPRALCNRFCGMVFGGFVVFAAASPHRQLAPLRRGFFMRVLRAARNQQRGWALGWWACLHFGRDRQARLWQAS